MVSCMSASKVGCWTSVLLSIFSTETQATVFGTLPHSISNTLINDNKNCKIGCTNNNRYSIQQAINNLLHRKLLDVLLNSYQQIPMLPPSQLAVPLHHPKFQLKQ